MRRRVVSKREKERLFLRQGLGNRNIFFFHVARECAPAVAKKKIFCPRYNRFGLGSGFDTGLTYHHPPPFLSFAAAAADGDIN